MRKITFGKVKQLDFKTNEAYKTLRTNILFSGEDIKVIAFTSSVPNEGKSSTSFHLAKSFAEDGKKILFMDADIRKSVILARHEADQEVVGLTHYLSGQDTKEDVIYASNIEHMDVIFTGQVAPNPAELLGTEKFKELIAYAREQYDYVVVDCPPLGSVIDAAIIAKECDGAVIVIESDNVSYRLIQKVKTQLEVSGCKILGAVLNKVDMSRTGYMYYGKGYYGNYGDYGNYNGEIQQEQAIESK